MAVLSFETFKGIEPLKGRTIPMKLNGVKLGYNDEMSSKNVIRGSISSFWFNVKDYDKIEKEIIENLTRIELGYAGVYDEEELYKYKDSIDKGQVWARLYGLDGAYAEIIVEYRNHPKLKGSQVGVYLGNQN